MPSSSESQLPPQADLQSQLLPQVGPQHLAICDFPLEQRETPQELNGGSQAPVESLQAGPTTTISTVLSTLPGESHSLPQGGLLSGPQELPGGIPTLLPQALPPQESATLSLPNHAAHEATEQVQCPDQVQAPNQVQQSLQWHALKPALFSSPPPPLIASPVSSPASPQRPSPRTPGWATPRRSVRLATKRRMGSMLQRA